MKKTLTFLLFFVTAMFAHAGATLTLDEGLKVKQGETFTVNVNLKNEAAVSGIEMKISLPSGLSFVGTEEEGETYYGEATDRSTASFSGATLSGNTLTVAFLATAAKNRIRAGSGSILKLTIKAAADATIGIGKIKLFGMEIAYPGASPENPADAEYDCNIYNIFTVTATSANAEMGSVTGGGSYESGTTATLTATATEGYHFQKWSNEETDNPYSFVVTGAAEFIASFAPNQYKMTFVLDNGEANIEKTLDYKSELKAPENVTKKGYSLTGWNPEVPATVPLGDKTYTAQWVLDTYTITYDLAGGALAEGVTNPGTYTTESENITLNNPTRTGYTFAGWTGTDLTEATTTVVIAKGSTGNRNYEATWTVNKYKVTFKDYNDDVLVAEAEYDYDSDLTGVAPDMTGKTNNDGAPFGGWNNNYTGKVPAFDVVYTAVYGGTFTLIFVVDGVTVQSGDVDYNTPITAPTSPEKEGYDFIGWKDQNGKDFNEYNGKMPAKNVTFTATWKAQQFTVTFVLNNGSPDLVYTQDYGSPVVAPEDPVKKGHTFLGWTPELATTVPTHNLTYEATYQINTYNVIYMVYGEEWARDQYVYDTPIEIRQYVGTILDDFRGWQSDAVYTTMPDHDVIYTADITKLDPISITSEMIETISDYTYTGNAIEPVVTVKYGEMTLVAGTDYTVSYSNNIDAGTATVTVTAVTGSFFAGSADKTFSILKADAVVKKIPVGLVVGYTGQAFELITAGLAEGGTMVYSLDNETYSASIPTGTEIADYIVYYKVVGDKNHNDVQAQTVTARIVQGYPLEVTAGGYVTYYNNKTLKLNITETDAMLYTINDVNDESVIVSEVSVAAAETPLLVYNNSNVTKTIILIPTEDAPANVAVYSGFKGTLEDKVMPASNTTDYYVCNGKDFIWVKNAGSIFANRCWLEIPKSANAAPRRSIVVGGGTTGINMTDYKQLTNDNYYDLNGRYIQGKPTKKGLYIMNGKKVIIR